MTLALSWVRSVGRSSELVCMTDSRLRFGGHWDCGPKLFPTLRGDSAVMFAGDTLYAYPIVAHLLTAISYHQKSLSRAMDLPELKGHLIRVLNAAVSNVADLPRGIDPAPVVEFIFTGYDWRRRDYRGWLIHYDRSINSFTFRPTKRWRGGNAAKFLMMAGDYQKEFKERLVALLKKKSKLSSGGFDMEPFEVLRDMLRSGKYECIGGPPQLLKIYPHLNCRPFGVWWPSLEAKTVSIGGRMLLDYETHQFLTIDPDTFKVDEA